LFGGGEIGERFADPPPTHAPIDIHQQSGVERDVFSAHASSRVQQAIRPNHPSFGIAQNRELVVYNLLPDEKRVLTIVSADGYNTRVCGIEFFSVTRELAQLAGAVGSPVSAIEDQQHAFTAQ